jgi:hypothetical protein
MVISLTLDSLLKGNFDHGKAFTLQECLCSLNAANKIITFPHYIAIHIERNLIDDWIPFKARNSILVPEEFDFALLGT